MAAPIFRFRNVRLRLTTTDATFVYGVMPYDNTYSYGTLFQNTGVDEVSSVILTVQIANILSNNNVNVSAFVQNSTGILINTASPLVSRLVSNYPLIPNNAFDPLSGNLVLSANDQIWVQASSANSCDVVVTLLEIANATAT